MLLAVVVASAQPQAATVAGRVSDSRGEAVEFANVVLYRLPDSVQVTGTVSGAGGSFELTPVPAGRYYLEVSFVGYQNRTVDEIELTEGGRADLGRIALREQAVAVQGAETVAEKPAMTYEVDKKVIEVRKLPTAQSGTAVDALENAPSVEVDIEGNVSLRGSENFTVLVDGRPTMLEPSAALQQIPASTIDKIEVITNPSVKYDPDGVAGVINVILKRQMMQGISALANAHAGFRNRHGGDLLLGYRHGIANLHAGGNYNRRAFHGQRDYESRTYTSGESLYVVGAGENSWSPRFGGGRAGVELQFGPSDKTTLSGRYGLVALANSFVSEVAERRVPGDSGRAYTSDGGWERDGDYYYLLADHQHDFDTTGHKLLARASLGGRGGEDRVSTVEIDSSGAMTSGRRTDEAGPFYRMEVEVEYSLPLRGSDELEAGVESRFEGADQDYRQYWYSVAADSFELDTLSSHRYSGTRDIYSAYATYNWKWRKLGVQFGIRGEFGDRVVEVPDMDTSHTVSRWDHFPSVHASLGLPVGQATASYSRRIQRPWPWMLRPFPTWQDARNLMQGNPELRPEYTDSYEAGFQVPFGRNMVSVEAYLRASSDVFQWVRSVSPDYPDVLVLTALNVGTERSTGVELMANVSPFRWWTVNLTGNLFDYRVEGELLGQDFEAGSFNWRGRLGSDFRLPTGTRVSLNGYYSSPSVSAQGENQGYFMTDAAVQQSLLGRSLTITLRMRDVLGTGGWEFTSEGPGFYNSIEYVHEGRVLTLALRYNFNNFRLDPKLREGEGIETEGAPQM